MSCWAPIVFGAPQHMGDYVREIRGSKPQRESHYAVPMTTGWRFIGEIWGERKRPIVLECIIPIANRKEAEAIARQRLAGADSITAIELRQPDQSASPA